MSRRYLCALVAFLCLAVALGTAATAGAGGLRSRHGHRARMHRVVSTRGTAPLRTALFDPYLFVDGDSLAYSMARAAGATYVRLPLDWRDVAPPVRPPGFVASNQASPGYTWAGLDRTVAAIEAAGLTPMLDVISPPKWAYAVRPRGVTAGTPNAKDLAQFSRALATHYEGRQGVPAVHVFQVWNEPNNSLDLSPVNPATYRNLVNAVANAVHGVDRRNVVIAGGLDPFENQAARFVSQAPLAYMRALLCVSKGKHPHATCKAKLHFDVWSHHPYTFGGPFGHARRRDDVSLGDLPKMRALLRAAVKLHRVVSSHPVQFWVTEFSWDTSPPRPHAAPVDLQARWTAESLYQMWRSGVSLVTWFLLQDRPSPNPFQSGLYFYAKSLAAARAKPTLTAFRFPFVAYRNGGAVTVWGRDATSSKELVTIQRRNGHGRWRTVARIRSNRYGIFTAELKLASTTRDWLRAVAPQSGKSLAFSLKRPSPRLRYGPWGN